MPIIRISFDEEITDEENEKLLSLLQSEGDVEKVKQLKDRSVGALSLITIALKVASTSIPVIQRLLKTIKKIGKEEVSLEFVCGESKQKVSIKGTMSTEEAAEFIKRVCG